MKDEIIVTNCLGYKRLKDGGCAVKNYADGGNVTVLDANEYALLKHINKYGVNAEKICEGTWLESALLKFTEQGIIRSKRILCTDKRYTCRTLIMFRKRRMSGNLRALMWLLSAATLLLSPISLLYIIRIIYIHHIGIAAIGDSLTVTAFLFSTALGISLHELAHVVATLASGARVFEIGILTHWIFFKGAYVLNDSDYSCWPIEQIRISMAGIEMNLILSATFLLFALAHPAWGLYALKHGNCWIIRKMQVIMCLTNWLKQSTNAEILRWEGYDGNCQYSE